MTASTPPLVDVIAEVNPHWTCPHKCECPRCKTQQIDYDWAE